MIEEEERKQLRILGAIASFLITEDKGDAATVTFMQSTIDMSLLFQELSM